MAFHDPAPALRDWRKPKTETERINDLYVMLAGLETRFETWLVKIEGCINKKTDAWNEALADIDRRLEQLEVELRGHRHNTFSGDYWVPFPVRKQLEGAEAPRRPGKAIKLYNVVTAKTYERYRDADGYIEIHGDELVIG